MLTNMLYGALGALAILSLRLLVQPARRLRTWTRTTYRRLIGMEHFEANVIDEMRTYRRDVDEWTRRVRSEMQDVRNDMRSRSTTLSAHGARTNSARREIEELGLLLRSYTETLGPIWNTAQGHRMPMRLLSTGHLENIIEGGFGSYEARDFARVELERRGIDASWRVRAERGEPAPTKEQMAARRAMKARSEELVRQSAGANPMIRTKLSVHPDTLTRVRDVLPLWAQELITDLRTRRTDALSFDERRRVRAVLPMWAQDLINDLLRRAKR